MAYFSLTGTFTVKTAKCRQMYTTGPAREGVVNTPTDPRSKLLLWVSSSLTQRGQSAGILNERLSIRKLGTFWLRDANGMRHVGGQF